MARCSMGAGVGDETPRTPASSALSRPAWNLRATSSRSRGQRAPGRRDGGAAQRELGVVLGRGGVDVGRLGGQRGAALAAAQLVERGVAGDAEQPRRARSRACACTGAACGRRARTPPRDVLGRRAIAQQRRDVGVDVVARGAVQRLEVQALARPCGNEREGQGAGHIRTTTRPGASITARRRRVCCSFDGAPRPHLQR